MNGHEDDEFLQIRVGNGIEVKVQGSRISSKVCGITTGGFSKAMATWAG